MRPGTRALILPLPGKPTLHDLVKIGNSVDIIAAFDGQESRTIVENVRVLAVDVFANDYPPVKAAMRGAYKAEPQGRAIAPASAPGAAPGASGAASNAVPDSVPPADNPTPTPAPQNLPPLDPALTLEVTPQQAAAIQLAQSSGAPLDFLVRPALPGNRSSEVTLVSDDGTPGAAPLTNGVTKRQIAPYAESVKRGGSGGGKASGKVAANAGASAGSSNGNSGGNSNASGKRPSTRNAFPVPEFPTVTTTTTRDLPTPFPVPSVVGKTGSGQSNGEFGSDSGKGERLAPRAPSTYQIPIYSDGGVVRTETVPVPIR